MPTTPTALEQSLLDLCAKHDLVAISFDVHPAHQPNSGFSVYVHWMVSSPSGRGCVSGTSGSIGEALQGAIAKMVGVRHPVDFAIADEALPELAA